MLFGSESRKHHIYCRYKREEGLLKGNRGEAGLGERHGESKERWALHTNALESCSHCSNTLRRGEDDRSGEVEKRVSIIVLPHLPLFFYLYFLTFNSLSFLLSFLLCLTLSLLLLITLILLLSLSLSSPIIFFFLVSVSPSLSLLLCLT